MSNVFLKGECVMKMSAPDPTYSHIFWDWNGTLLDDAQQSLDCFAQMLEERGMKPVAGLDDYRKHFSFPVRNYYQYIGFDMEREPFEQLAVRYMELYHAPDMVWSLHHDAEATLRWIADRGIRQVILTASERSYLDAQLSSFDIRPFFDAFLTLDDIHAHGKIAIGRAYLEQNPVRRGLMIGDSVHDYEVAGALGFDCVLVARGHTAKNVLAACGVPVFDDLAGVCAFIGKKR